MGEGGRGKGEGGRKREKGEWACTGVELFR